MPENDPDCVKKSVMTRVAGCLQPIRSVECVMAHILGEDRSRLLLLPDAVDDYAGPDNPVRFIDAFVSGLDLEAAGFERVSPRDGASGLRSGGSSQALHLRLSEPGSVKPPSGAGDASQPGGDLAAAPVASGLQDDCGLPARQQECVPPGVPRVREALPRTIAPAPSPDPADDCQPHVPRPTATPPEQAPDQIAISGGR